MRSISSVFLLLLVVVATTFIAVAHTAEVPVPNAYFLETFDDAALFKQRWHKSEATKQTEAGIKDQFDGQWTTAEPTVIPTNVSTKGLLLQSPAKHHAISAKLDQPVDFHQEDRAFVVQFEVKQQETVQCGGSYIKLLSASEDFDPRQFNDKTPYTIMFGPDKCGTTNKVHFIFRHVNPITNEIEEKHLSKTISTSADTRFSNLYTLIVKPDNTFSVLINLEKQAGGSLFDSFEPPVNPPKEIPDPTDLKPKDWVDIEKIPDPEATKPDDWDEDAPKTIEDLDAVKPSDWLDDEPLYIADPAAAKPTDWSDEDDGEYVAPQVPNPKCDKVSGCGVWTRPTKKNPAYKGKWSAPLIPNPLYKGPFVPRQIPNPNYFYDAEPHKFTSIGAVGFELWTLQANILFDNILLTSSPEEAEAYAEATWRPKFEQEGASVKRETSKDKPSYVLLVEEAVEQLQAFMKIVFNDPVKAVTKYPLVPAVIVGVPLLVIILVLLFTPPVQPRRLQQRQQRQQQQQPEQEQQQQEQPATATEIKTEHEEETTKEEEAKEEEETSTEANADSNQEPASESEATQK